MCTTIVFSVDAIAYWYNHWYNFIAYFISSFIVCSVRHAFIRIKTYPNCFFASYQMSLTFESLTASSIDSIIHFNLSRIKIMSIDCPSTVWLVIVEGPKRILFAWFVHKFSWEFCTILSIFVVAAGNKIYQKNWNIYSLFYFSSSSI